MKTCTKIYIMKVSSTTADNMGAYTFKGYKSDEDSSLTTTYIKTLLGDMGLENF